MQHYYGLRSCTPSRTESRYLRSTSTLQARTGTIGNRLVVLRVVSILPVQAVPYSITPTTVFLLSVSRVLESAVNSEVRV